MGSLEGIIGLKASTGRGCLMSKRTDPGQGDKGTAGGTGFLHYSADNKYAPRLTWLSQSVHLPAMLANDPVIPSALGFGVLFHFACREW